MILPISLMISKDQFEFNQKNLGILIDWSHPKLMTFFDYIDGECIFLIGECSMIHICYLFENQLNDNEKMVEKEPILLKHINKLDVMIEVLPFLLTTSQLSQQLLRLICLPLVHQ
ncbi:hypothetical protein ACTA71_007344 [Dictyostelium dimigraforme]